MINITDSAAFARALDSPLDPELRRILTMRRDQLLADIDPDQLGDLVQFIAVEPNDNVPSIEAAANYPLITEPAFEWTVQHANWFEAVTILSDDGFGIALFVPDDEAIDPTVLKVVRGQAVTTSIT